MCIRDSVKSSKKTILDQIDFSKRMADQRRIDEENRKSAQDAADRKNITKIQQYTGQPLSDYRMSRPASERRETVSYAPQGTTTFDTKSGMGRRDYVQGGLASLWPK